MGGIKRLRGRISGTESERGAVLVEAAFITTLLIMLLLGTVTAGLAYGQSNALQTAAREGARFGATLPRGGSWLDSVIDVTKAAAVGDLDGTVPGQWICVALVDGGSTESMTEVAGARSTGTAECFADGRPADEMRVQVAVRREATINAAIFTTTVDLESESAARYER